MAATADPSQPAGGGSLFASLFPFAIIIGIFYFILIRPARKRQKDLETLVQALKPGDRVLTTGGLFGTIVGVAEDRLQLRIADQVNIDIAKNAVAGRSEEPL